MILVSVFAMEAINQYWFPEFLHFQSLFFVYNEKMKISDILGKEEELIQSIMSYEIEHISVWDDWNPVDLTRFNGTHLTRFNLESNRLIIQSSGYSRTMRCVFRTQNQSIPIENEAYYINQTHLWCRSPHSIGKSYELTLQDSSFNRKKSSRSTYILIELTPLKIINQPDSDEVMIQDSLVY